jgi:serine/threonine protein kinase
VRCPRCQDEISEAARSSRKSFFCPACGTRLLVSADGLAIDEAATPTETADPLLGSVVAQRYKLLRQLGSGGMGAVYVAEQLGLGRDVAVKVIRRSLIEEQSAVDRFITEARAVARLNHPNIVTLHDFGDDGSGGLFIAMELVAGESLRARLRRSPMPWRDVARVGVQLVEALSAVHAVPIIHRDLKPENVMLGSAGAYEIVKLLDFGVAKLVDSDDTGTNLIVGTPGYLAPETHDNIKDPRGDLYALGVMFFEMLTGAAPYSAANAMSLMLKHVSEPVPRASTTTEAEIPRALDELVVALMQKKPEQRPIDARAVRQRLEAILGDAASTPLPRAGVATPSGSARVAGGVTLGPRPAAQRVVAGKYRIVERMFSKPTRAGELVLLEGEIDLSVYETYVAIQEGLGRRVALKIYERRGVLVNADLLDDVRAIARLRHPSIAAVLDCGFDEDGALFVASELVDGDALDVRIARGAMPLRLTLAIAHKIAEALAVAHGEGIVHQGLQPSGILLLRKGARDTPVILDFGVGDAVRAQLAAAKAAALKTTTLTTSPPRYSAPERHRGVRERRGDLYALGCIVFEMLTARPVFAQRTALGMVTSHTLDAPPRLSTAIAPSPAEVSAFVIVDELLASLLAKEPDDRPATAIDVVATLHRAVAALPA